MERVPTQTDLLRLCDTAIRFHRCCETELKNHCGCKQDVDELVNELKRVVDTIPRPRNLCFYFDSVRLEPAEPTIPWQGWSDTVYPVFIQSILAAGECVLIWAQVDLDLLPLPRAGITPSTGVRCSLNSIPSLVSTRM